MSELNGMPKFNFTHRITLILGVFLFPLSGFAYTHVLPESLVEEVLSESVPTAFSPTGLGAQDFSVEWIGAPLPDVEIVLGKESLEWVRVADFLVLPRGRLLVTAHSLEGGLLTSGGFSQSLVIHEGEGRAELPIALLSGEKNPIRLTLRRGGIEKKGTLQVRFKPRQVSPHFEASTGIFTDPSCSPFNVRAVSTGDYSNQWIYVGCRLVYVEGSEYRTASLEMFVYWDNVGQEIEIDGVKTSAPSASAWKLRLRSAPGKVRLKAGEREVVLNYFAAEKLHLGSLGIGIGPYAYTFVSFDANIDTIAPVVTLYGSYFITESMRAVMFDATAINKKYFTDFGFYINYESFKAIDRRFFLNFMLGAHVIGFNAEGSSHYNFGAPQGVELIFKDAFHKGYNLASGAFIYPPIHGKLYYNAWVRWGGASFFAEINYIAWQEILDQDRAYNRSMGVTFGIPLARFL